MIPNGQGIFGISLNFKEHIDAGKLLKHFRVQSFIISVKVSHLDHTGTSVLKLCWSLLILPEYIAEGRAVPPAPTCSHMYKKERADTWLKGLTLR